MPTSIDILHGLGHLGEPMEKTNFQTGEMTYNFGRFNMAGDKIKKWLHQFENVAAVIILIDLLSYFQISRSTTHLYPKSQVEHRVLKTDLALHEQIINSPWLRRSGIIVIFMNEDLFHEALLYTSVSSIWSDYEGPDKARAITEYIYDRFETIERTGADPLPIYRHVTNSADASLWPFIVHAVNDAMITQYLKDNGLK